MDFYDSFSSFSVKDLDEATQFYSDLLGLEVIVEKDMGIRIKLKEGSEVFAYPKENHTPATFTVLNFVVKDIEKAVDELTEKGIKFEHYNMGESKTDEKGIMRGKDLGMSPDMAWFTDPFGNIIGIMQTN